MATATFQRSDQQAEYVVSVDVVVSSSTFTLGDFIFKSVADVVVKNVGNDICVFEVSIVTTIVHGCFTTAHTLHSMQVRKGNEVGEGQVRIHTMVAAATNSSSAPVFGLVVGAMGV